MGGFFLVVKKRSGFFFPYEECVFGVWGKQRTLDILITSKPPVFTDGGICEKSHFGGNSLELL